MVSFVLLMAGLAAISVFAALKLIGFLRHGEGWFRGSHVSRREAPRLYWVTVGALTFTVVVTGVGVCALSTMPLMLS